MRELIDALLQIGLKVEFAPDATGATRISVRPWADTQADKPLFACSLTAGTFKESSEEALSEFLRSIQKRH